MSSEQKNLLIPKVAQNIKGQTDSFDYMELKIWP